MTTRSVRTLAASSLVMTLALTSAGVSAQQGRPLPAFTAVLAAGAAVQSSRLNAAEHWLLVYVTLDTVVGERLLRSLDNWTADGGRVVIVAFGAAGDVHEKIRPLLPNLLPA